MTDRSRNLLNILTQTNKTVFSTRDLNKLWKYENYRSLIQRISYLQKTNKLYQIKKGLYAVNGKPVNDLELSNKLRTPSYISFETVLYQNGIIFQWDTRITLAGKESIKIKLEDKTIIFRQIKDSILLNQQGIKRTDNYYSAIPERALMDMLYIDSKFTFDNLRKIDFELCHQLSEIYNRKKIMTQLIKLQQHARSY